MPDPIDHKRNWLVAAWPGMGNVAVIAAGYLIRKLNLKPVAEMPTGAGEHFDLQGVEVSEGVVTAPRLPRSVFFQNPSGGPGPRLTVFLGEAQPSSGSYAYAHKLLEKAAEYAPERVITFASMATQLHPTQAPRVFGVSTKADMLDELQRLEVKLLEDGQIGGMNGLLLGAASERGLPGMCLMGEIPYFAAGVPNPKAAKAVLDAFALMAGLEIDLEELNKDAEMIDRALVEMLEKMQKQGEAEDVEEPDIDETPSGSAPTPAPAPAIDAAAQERIERMFKDAEKDRSRSMHLKKELDRLGVFSLYENRFLDLFKRAD